MYGHPCYEKYADQQAIEEIQQAPEEDWNKKLCKTFIGESLDE